MPLWHLMFMVEREYGEGELWLQVGEDEEKRKRRERKRDFKLSD